jgi:hypothetical protein
VWKIDRGLAGIDGLLDANGIVTRVILPGAEALHVGRKTVTVALSAEQFAWLKEPLAHQREVWDILTKMQQLTVRQLWKLPGTTRRKRLSKKTLGLN